MKGDRIRRSTLRLAWAGVALAALLVDCHDDSGALLLSFCDAW